MVPHHEHVARRHHHLVELSRSAVVGGRHVQGRIAQHVRLVQRLPVDQHPALIVAARDPITRQPDDPLDVVLLAGLADPDQVPQRPPDPGREPRSVLGVLRCPSVGAAEDHDLAAGRLPEVVDELVDQHPVAGHQGVLHRTGRDDERLQQEGADQHRQAEGDHQQQRQLLPQRKAFTPLPLPAGRRPLTVACRGHAAPARRAGRPAGGHRLPAAVAPTATRRSSAGG